MTAMIYAKEDSYAVEESVLVGLPVKNDASKNPKLCSSNLSNSKNGQSPQKKKQRTTPKRASLPVQHVQTLLKSFHSRQADIYGLLILSTAEGTSIGEL